MVGDLIDIYVYTGSPSRGHVRVRERHVSCVKRDAVSGARAQSRPEGNAVRSRTMERAGEGEREREAGSIKQKGNHSSQREDRREGFMHSQSS